MSDDLIKRLRRGNNGQEIEAAERIEELEAKLTKAVKALRKIVMLDYENRLKQLEAKAGVEQ